MYVVRNLRLGLKCAISHDEEHLVSLTVIFCDLVVVNQDDWSSSFQALSYSWGSALPQQRGNQSEETGLSHVVNRGVDYVLCSGGKIDITHNLISALLQTLKLGKDTSF